MGEHNFTLTIQGTYSDAVLDALFEAGCDDATISHKGDLLFAEFDREADSLLDAVVSAIGDVESVDGPAALHVDPDDLVWASEIAERLGRTRQSVDLLIKGQRGPGGFPAPTSTRPVTRSGGGRRSRRGSRSTRAAPPTPSEAPSWAPSTGRCRPVAAPAAATTRSSSSTPPSTSSPRSEAARRDVQTLATSGGHGTHVVPRRFHPKNGDALAPAGACRIVRPDGRPGGFAAPTRCGCARYGSVSYRPWSQAVIATRDRVLGMVIASRGFVEGVR